MKLLLDSHVLLWWLRDHPKLGWRTRDAIADRRNDLVVSIASFWEFSIKYRIGKENERGTALLAETISAGIEVLQIRSGHLLALEVLERMPGHNDPFDHIILAQARAEEVLLVTADKKLLSYDVPVLRF